MFVCYYCSTDVFRVFGREVGKMTGLFLKRDEAGRYDGWKPIEVGGNCIA